MCQLKTPNPEKNNMSKFEPNDLVTFKRNWMGLYPKGMTDEHAIGVVLGNSDLPSYEYRHREGSEEYPLSPYLLVMWSGGDIDHVHRKELIHFTPTENHEG